MAEPYGAWKLVETSLQQFTTSRPHYTETHDVSLELRCLWCADITTLSTCIMQMAPRLCCRELPEPYSESHCTAFCCEHTSHIYRSHVEQQLYPKCAEEIDMYSENMIFTLIFSNLIPKFIRYMSYYSEKTMGWTSGIRFLPGPGISYSLPRSGRLCPVGTGDS